MNAIIERVHRRRGDGAIFLLSLATAALLTVFFEVQVLGSGRCGVRADENRFRGVVLAAPEFVVAVLVEHGVRWCRRREPGVGRSGRLV